MPVLRITVLAAELVLNSLLWCLSCRKANEKKSLGKLFSAAAVISLYYSATHTVVTRTTEATGITAGKGLTLNVNYN